ncbi:MAG TPA: hypothetical protein PK981_08005 [Accumulibacter sp.]|nr:hypothetical protein [Accumulibacter sp.]HNG38973.1 hypothetical protein [Accumulibacter sp.]HNI74176.1 hypothetical protein [Accumulibacter sp.]HNL14633.1 hypothetical protein [Accumulibacter sp.]
MLLPEKIPVLVPGKPKMGGTFRGAGVTVPDAGSYLSPKEENSDTSSIVGLSARDRYRSGDHTEPFSTRASMNPSFSSSQIALQVISG